MNSQNGKRAASVTLGVDVGGTKVRAGVVNPDGTIAGPVVEFNPRAEASADIILGNFAAGLGQVLKASPVPVAGIGIGMPGPFDYQRGIALMKGVAKYDSLYGINLGEALRHRLSLDRGIPIVFVNDAAAFALGEWAFGSARPYERVIAVTLGTGCGSSFLAHGKVVHQGEGLPPGGYIYNIPFRDGVIDDYISRRGILTLWKERFQKEARADGPGSEVDVKDLARAAFQGSEAASQLFQTWGTWIAQALAGVIRSFRPDCLLFGGNISRSLPLFSAPIENHLSSLPWQVDLVVGADLENAGVKGAAMLAGSC